MMILNANVLLVKWNFMSSTNASNGIQADIILDENTRPSIQNLKKAYQEVIEHWAGDCPFCNTQFVKNGGYVRKTPELFAGLRIQRVYCESCRKSHALLPCFIIPYRRQLTSYDDTIIRCIAFEICSVERLAEVLAVEPASISRWWRRVKNSLPKVVDTIAQLLANTHYPTDWISNYSQDPRKHACKLFELIGILRTKVLEDCPAVEDFALINMIDPYLFLDWSVP